jgi:hypothetical protein
MTLTSRSSHVCDPKRLALVRFVCPYSYVAQDPTLRGIARMPATNTASPQSTSFAIELRNRLACGPVYTGDVS